MTPHARRSAQQRATAIRSAAEREASRLVAVAVSSALRKADRAAGELVKVVTAENRDLKAIVAQMRAELKGLEASRGSAEKREA